ncbi:MAG: RNA polymerase sigma factor [Acidobacteria bacterium]|nr:RNA polymerase sigma factor [Acidobacteriota bacterium]
MDQKLVARCRRGEIPAFEELYARHSSRLYSVAYRITGSAADAEDLLQEIFLQVYRRLDSYRGEAALGTWLHRLAVNACLDHVRSKQGRRQQATDYLEDLEHLEPVAPGSWRPWPDARAPERAVAQLPPSYRQAFLLHDVEGLEHHEVSDMLGIAVGTSKSLVHKARLRLRTLLRGRTGPPAPRPATLAPVAAAGLHGER